MPISIPKFFQRAFAQNGGKQDVPITGDTSGGRASYDVGFPPVTRIPIVAGGIPPFGTDFNGILYDLSAAIQYQQSGVLPPFNSAFATAIGGYDVGAIVSDAADKSILWINGIADNLSYPTGWTQTSLKQATEIIQGTSKIATQAEVNAGTSDTASVTPKKLRAGFSANLARNGFIALPTWLGGLIFQWGTSVMSSNNTAITVVFPLQFPTDYFYLGLTPSQVAGTATSAWRVGISNSNFSYAVSSGGGGTAAMFWFAVGN